MKNKIHSLKDIFPDWSESDLQAVLEEANGDLQLAISRISEGFAVQWEVQSGKKKTNKKVSENNSSSFDERSRSSGRGRGSFRGRGRGSGRGRGRGGSRSSRPYTDNSQNTWSAEPDANVSAEWTVIPDSNETGGWDSTPQNNDADTGAWDSAQDKTETSGWDEPSNNNSREDESTGWDSSPATKSTRKDAGSEKVESSGWDSTPPATATSSGWDAAPATNQSSGWGAPVRSVVAKPVKHVAEKKSTSSKPAAGKTSWAQLVKSSIEPKVEPEPPKPAAPIPPASQSLPASPKRDKSPARLVSPARPPTSPKKTEVIPEVSATASIAPVVEKPPVAEKPVVVESKLEKKSAVAAPPGLNSTISATLTKVTPASAATTSTAPSMAKKSKQDAPVVMPSVNPVTTLEMQFGALKVGKTTPVEPASSPENTVNKTARLPSPAHPAVALSSSGASSAPATTTSIQKPSATVPPATTAPVEPIAPAVSAAPGLGAPGLNAGLLPTNTYFPYQQTPFGVPLGGHLPQDFASLYQSADASRVLPGYYGADPSMYPTSTSAGAVPTSTKFGDSTAIGTTNGPAVTSTQAPGSTAGGVTQPGQAPGLSLGSSAPGVPHLNGYMPPMSMYPNPYYNPYYMNQFTSPYQVQNPSMYQQPQFLGKTGYGHAFNQPGVSAPGVSQPVGAPQNSNGNVTASQSVQQQQKSGFPGSGATSTLTGTPGMTNPNSGGNPSLGYGYGAPAGQGFYQAGGMQGYDDLTSSIGASNSHDYSKSSYGQPGVFGNSQFGNKGGSDYKQNRQNTRYDKYSNSSNTSSHTNNNSNLQNGPGSAPSGQGQSGQQYYNQGFHHGYGQPMMHPQHQYGNPNSNMGYGSHPSGRGQYWNGQN